MTTTLPGALNQLSAIGQEFTGAVPLRSAANNSAAESASDAGAATITANDFLTLLVTELKNQDPTANTDPNEYINQLVQVNSLEQLISINQTLIADSQASPGNSTAGRETTIHAGSITANHAPHGMGATAARMEANKPEQSAASNFSIPAPDPSAQRVAQALSGAHSAA